MASPGTKFRLPSIKNVTIWTYNTCFLKYVQRDGLYPPVHCRGGKHFLLRRVPWKLWLTMHCAPDISSYYCACVWPAVEIQAERCAEECQDSLPNTWAAGVTRPPPAPFLSLSLTIFSSSKDTLSLLLPLSISTPSGSWAPYAGMSTLTTVADTWALKPREFSCTHYWANFTRKRVIPSGFLKSSYHYPIQQPGLEASLASWERRLILELLLSQPSPSSEARHSKLLNTICWGPKMSVKLTLRHHRWSDEGSSCSRWPGCLTTDFKWHTLAQPWPWHSVCNKGKPETLAELNSSPCFFWA